MAICDDSSLSCDFSRPYDLCIIGSGAAGIAIAYKLRNTNQRICVLESSTVNEPQRASVQLVQQHETTSSPAAQALLQANAAAGWNPDNHRYEDPVAQTLYEGELTKPMLDIDDRFLRRSRIRVFGGTTNCWGGWTRPLSEIDFDRSDMNEAWKWPISLKELRSYYQQALEYCALDRPDHRIRPDDYENPNLWPSRTAEPAEPLASKTPDVRTAIFTAMYGGDSGGVKNGALNFQCVYGPWLKQAGVCVERDVSVRGFEVDGRTVKAAYATRIDRSGPEPKPGKDVTIVAKRFVLAVGGIEGPRLLLLTKDGGLGNSAGHLGQNFMIHPVIENARYFEGPPDVVPPKVRAFYRNWPAMKMIGNEPPSFWATYVPTDAAMRRRKIGNFRMIVDYYTQGGGKLNLNWEQFPNPKSVIELSKTKKDLFTDKRVKVDWNLLDEDLTTRDVAVELVMAELKEWGFATEETGGFGKMIPGDHHMGATKMSAHPKDGYVNTDCRLHEIDNLYIASSSVMPTGGVANVTLTIIALALRLADHLAGQR